MPRMSFTIPHYEMPKITPIAEQAFEDLIDEIKLFQEGLSDEMEVGIVANGAGLTIHVEGVHISGI